MAIDVIVLELEIPLPWRTEYAWYVMLCSEQYCAVSVSKLPTVISHWLTIGLMVLVFANASK